MQLLAVSDPIRRGELWELNSASSVRYVRQAVRMRVADTIALRLTAQPIGEWRDALAAAAAARAATSAAEAAAVEEALAPAPGAEPGSDLLANIVAASMDASDGEGELTAAGREAGRQLSAAARVDAEFVAGQVVAPAEQAAAARALTDYERRRQRRKEYFEQQSGRNDTPFFAAVAALFLLPPAVILTWAWSSGLLASLDQFGPMLQ